MSGPGSTSGIIANLIPLNESVAITRARAGIGLSVQVVHGSSQGPCLFVSAVIHGVLPQAALKRLRTAWKCSRR